MTKAKKILRVYTVDGKYYMFVGSYAKHMLKSIEQAVEYKSIRTKSHEDFRGVEVSFILQNIVNTEVTYEVQKETSSN